jgi:ATP-dependent exoDNAse (exonuclease V) alpha subunit
MVAASITPKEATLGRPLTDGQHDLVEGVCGSGRRVELVLGVAGSGKTTALDAVRAAFEHAGFEVLGTATSGQAARNLGAEAGMESRTIASFLNRLDKGHTPFGARTVLIVDEAGMTNDQHLARLLHAARQAGAKLILAGDDRQLAAVGPGGGLGALLARHPDLVHRLDENVRQHDPGEHRALHHLRAGNPAKAVAWYATHDRITIAPTRDEALDQTVDAWHADIQAGKHTGMLAWRRANVAELNHRARTRSATDGRLSGPVLVTEGGRRYQAGDRVVTLAPADYGRIVTSRPAPSPTSIRQTGR